jgi:hypothetical protein
MSNDDLDFNVMTEYQKAFIDGQEHEREQHRSYRLEKLVMFLFGVMEKKGLIESGDIGDYVHYLHTGDWK